MKMIIFRFYMTLVFGFLLLQPSFSQAKIIDQRINALHEAINSSDKDLWQSFIKENFCLNFKDSHPMDHHMEMMQQMHEGCDNCEIANVEMMGNKLNIDFQSGNTTLLFEIDLAQDEEYKFCGFNIEEGQGLTPIALVDIRSKDFSQGIDHLIQEYRALDIFSGVVLIADKGIPVYQKAFGDANREKGIKNTIHTLFDIGSMNKTFTQVVIYQLISEGKLKFSDRLSSYVTGFSDTRANAITIQQLLHHESGMGDYHDREYFELSKNQRTRKYIEDKIISMSLLFDPGEGNEYSNSGYVMLGAVIEKITGKSYYQNVQERIIDPLDLKNTYLEDLDQYRNQRATGYFKTPFGELRTNDQFMDIANADGGFLSTVADIMKFYRSYYYTDILIPEKMKENDPQFQFLRSLPPGRAPMAAGGYDGFNTAMYQVFQDDVSIIVFSNMDEPAGEQLAAGILDLARGEEAQKPAFPAKMNIVNAYQKKGVDYVKAHFAELTTNYHPSDPKEWILNDLGYNYLYERNDLDSALDMFQLNTAIFPEDANVWDSLGEAWLKKGDKKKALKYYQKALAMDPELESAQEAIKKIKSIK